MAAFTPQRSDRLVDVPSAEPGVCRAVRGGGTSTTAKQAVQLTPDDQSCIATLLERDLDLYNEAKTYILNTDGSASINNE
jgi:hypothetical protein